MTDLSPEEVALTLTNNTYSVEINNELVDINDLINKFIVSLKNIGINNDTKITVAKCIRINGEIGKIIKESKTIYNKIHNLESTEKASIIIRILIASLNSEQMKEILNEDQIKKIEEFSNDSETVETVIALVDWVSDVVLDTIDLDNDGFITEEELDVCVTKYCLCKGHCGQDSEGCSCYQTNACCHCYQSLVKSFSSCWSTFFLKCLCCAGNKKKVEID